MQLKDFHYTVPEELIADHPIKKRGESRLLHLNKSNGSIEDRHYYDLVDILKEGDVLVLNDTKVIKARLITQKSSSTKREIVLVEQHGKVDDWLSHRVLYRGRLKKDDVLHIAEHELIVKEILGNGLAIIHSKVDLRELAERYGNVPLPPYMNRTATDDDIERYQTVFAREAGSVAAPTASLNMTDEILQKLKDKGVAVVYVTLHVGLGTFLPIRVDDIAKHKMHQEYFSIPQASAKLIREAKLSERRVIALGTTVTRTLEYAHDTIMGTSDHDIVGEADIFIYPGYDFKIINGLITNYHAPESTVLMLTAAFASWDKLKPAYDHAVNQQYRFFSYGDSMIIL